MFNKIEFAGSRDKLIQLIVVLLAMFMLFYLVEIFFYFYYKTDVANANYHENILYWLVVPAKLSAFIVKPWTIITYFLLHFSFMHLIGNLLWLYAFGFVLQDMIGSEKLLPIFILGNIVGGIFFLISSALMSSFGVHILQNHLIGCTSGVIAVAAAITTVLPKYKVLRMFFGGMPLYVLFIIFIVLLLLSIDLSSLNSVFTYLGSALFGYYYGWQINRGNDIGKWVNKLLDKFPIKIF